MGTVVEEQLQTIQDNVDDAYTALRSKGATLPAVGSRGTENLASTISTVGAYSKKFLKVVNGEARQPYPFVFDQNTFKGITSVAWAACRDMFKSSDNWYGDIVFPDLTTLSGSAFEYAFGNNYQTDHDITVEFPKLSTIGVTNPFNYTFLNVLRLTSVSFPELTTSSGYRAFYQTFMYSSGGTQPPLTVSFPKLKSITGEWVQAFWGRKGLTTITFPELQTISASMYQVFGNCTNLAYAAFPKLTSVGTGNIANIFYDCPGLTEIHFKESAQSMVEALGGYSKKFGATNATIYFDL